MPSYPLIDKGEGLICTHDLLEVLRADIDSAYQALEAERESQYLRRCVVRAIFSFIEAVVECLKVELRSTVRLGYYPENALTLKDRETLGSLTIFGRSSGKFLPLDQNIKRTFKLAAKVWALQFRLSTDGEDYRDFIAAKSARNSLTHPRTFYDVQVTDLDMHCHTIAGMWMQTEFNRLFKARVESLMQALSDPDRKHLLLGTALSEPDSHPLHRESMLAQTLPTRACPASGTSYAVSPLLTFARKPWTYGRFIQNREYLQDDSDFDSLVGEIKDALAAATSQDVRFQLEPSNGKYGRDDLLLRRLQCRRASWSIRLCSKLLDKFFNGRMGIRAQYYLSPYHGRAMNARLLSALRPRLLALAREAVPLGDQVMIELSLAAASAKTWICEKNMAGNKIIRASDLALVEDEIQNDWLDLARAVKDGAAPLGQFQLYSAAYNGVQAPIADQFEVKGGWISRDDRCEYVTPAKYDRDCQVFMFGFT
ncbi:hypothetical protein D3C84_198630 [compost metagenome]